MKHNRKTPRNIYVQTPLFLSSSLPFFLAFVEKQFKYKDLKIEIIRVYGMKTKTIPVVIGALGLVKKGLEKFI